MNLNLACWRWEKHYLHVLLKVNAVDFFLLFYSSIILFIIKLAIYPALPRLSFLGSYFALRVFGLYNSFVRKHIFDTELAISATFGSEIQTFRPIIVWPLSQRFHRAILCQNRFSSFVRKRILDSGSAFSATFGIEIQKSGPVTTWPGSQRLHRAIICQNRFSSFVRKRILDSESAFSATFGSEIQKSGPVMTSPGSIRFHRAIICQNRFSSLVRKRAQTDTQTHIQIFLLFV